MYEAVMIAATGLKSQQRRLDVIADNVANINTVGFKGARVDFKDALYTARSLGPVGTPEGNLQKGHGTIVGAANRTYRDGSQLVTNNELDFALEGEGYFELERPDGESIYTRAGNYYITQTDGGLYLVNANGYFLHDTAGNRITIPDGAHSITVNQAGEISYTVGGEPATGQTVGMFTFTNITGLEAVGTSAYRESAASGQKLRAPAALKQGALEASNVDLSEEMTRMIRAQRAFSLASRALQTADDMEGIANNMRK